MRKVLTSISLLGSEGTVIPFRLQAGDGTEAVVACRGSWPTLAQPKRLHTTACILIRAGRRFYIATCSFRNLKGSSRILPACRASLFCLAFSTVLVATKYRVAAKTGQMTAVLPVHAVGLSEELGILYFIKYMRGKPLNAVSHNVAGFQHAIPSKTKV